MVSCGAGILGLLGLLAFPQLGVAVQTEASRMDQLRRGETLSSKR